MGTTLSALVVRHRALFRKKCDRLERRIDDALGDARYSRDALVLRNNFDVFENSVISEVSLRFANLDIIRSADGHELHIRPIR
jgi:hypothetical protein